MKKRKIILIGILVMAAVGGGVYFYKKGNIRGPKPTPGATPMISEASKKEVSFNDKIALASYYGWYYKDAAWAERTNAEHPLAGSYNPDDDKIVDYQITLARDIGLDGFVYSWNGVGNPNDKALIRMLQKIETSERYPTFKMAPLYENINFEYKGPNQNFIDELSYLINLSKNHPSFLKINGQPVIFVYNPQTIDLGRWQQVLDQVKINAGEAYYIAMPDNWDVSDDYFKYFQTITTYADKYISLEDISEHYQGLKKAGKPLIGTLIGGTRLIEKDDFKIDRSGGQYLKSRYEIAKKNNANWLYVTSWNEWYEFNQIEPSRETMFETAVYLREILANFKKETLSDISAVMTLTKGKKQTTIKNEGPSNIYYVRCGPDDKASLLLAPVMRPGEQQTFNYNCYNSSAWTLDNKKLQY